MEALFYRKLNGKVKCTLCPRGCVIAEGKRGFCRVRENREGKLFSLVYGRPVSIAIDPIEKKPLFHFYPGTDFLSYSTVGCNFACKFCQNWEISQASPEDFNVPYVSPERMVELARGTRGIAHTYTEPTVFYEYAYDISKLAHEVGLVNVFVTNGFTNPRPLRKISKFLDGANIDLKAFDEDFYLKVVSAPLKPVLKSIKLYKKLGIWVELTNLIIPGLNDDPDMIREMVKWIKKNVGSETPLHFSRFYPHYKMGDKPITPVETLERAREIAKEEGLKYVYLGNVPHEGENTYCWKCGELLVERRGFYVLRNVLTHEKRCPKCGAKQYFVF
ncbi:AmmeMemoRadiSam system radical SAM enzyme [Nanoarchaeota archaeon]|nr:MAG: AmmeMemoRadiSam system radical SAM enzyme [Nanoarchaeota archaeon]